MSVLYPNSELSDAECIEALGLPRCPPMLTRLVQESTRVEPDLEAIVRLIREDEAMLEAMLKAARSPLLGPNRGADTIEAAVEGLGLRWCINQAESVMLRRALEALGPVVGETAWRAFIERAFIVAYLARELGVANFYDAHTFGMFRECGTAFMLAKHADYSAWQEMAEVAGVRNITRLERRHYGIDHASVGALLAQTWGLPERLWHPIRLHHLRDELLVSANLYDSLTRRFVAVGALADAISGAHRLPRAAAYWERELDFACRVLGMDRAEIETFRSDVMLLLEYP